jgi:hypothetical protein
MIWDWSRRRTLDLLLDLNSNGGFKRILEPR